MNYRINYFSTTKRKNKYNAKSQQFGGRTYHSKFEARYAEDLEWRKKAGEIEEIIPQYKIELKVNGVLVCRYYVDFKIVLADGSIEYHEVKGFETEIYRLKKKLFLALLPEIDPGAEYIVIK